MLERDNVINNIVEKNFDFTFQELPYVKKINLRGNSNDKNFVTSNETALETSLPNKPNTYSNNGKIKILWLGPNEWLVVDEIKKESNELLIKLQNINNKNESSVTDVSENRTVLRISGDKLFILLSKFLVLDLDKNLINKSSVCQTLFVKVPIIITLNDKNVTDIFVNRSHANYIYKLLVDGAKNLDF
tara:strand:- start:225 stop:788 length:564 start_codon:yes stop_codon:yes gene_type:complete